ncbi:MAG: hypothetical protein EXR07_21330 [Acetobacteraceae bacterium]|nr:hypothetical protein [Acetobacteraceae bacterium]
MSVPAAPPAPLQSRPAGSRWCSRAGLANTATVLNGGTEIVSSGGTAAATVVSSGGALTIANGGTVVGTTQRQGGFMDFQGLAFDTAGSIDLDTGTGVATIVENGGTVLTQFAGDYTGLLFRHGSRGAVAAAPVKHPRLRGGRHGRNRLPDWRHDTMAAHRIDPPADALARLTEAGQPDGKRPRHCRP